MSLHETIIFMHIYMSTHKSITHTHPHPSAHPPTHPPTEPDSGALTSTRCCKSLDLDFVLVIFA